MPFKYDMTIPIYSDTVDSVSDIQKHIEELSISSHDISHVSVFPEHYNFDAMLSVVKRYISR